MEQIYSHTATVNLVEIRFLRNSNLNEIKILCLWVWVWNSSPTNGNMNMQPPKTPSPPHNCTNELSSECTNKRFVDVCNSSYISISLCYVQLFADITLLQIWSHNILDTFIHNWLFDTFDFSLKVFRLHLLLSVVFPENYESLLILRYIYIRVQFKNIFKYFVW